MTTEESKFGFPLFFESVISFLLFERGSRHAGHTVEGHQTEKLLPSCHDELLSVSRNSERLGRALRIESPELSPRRRRIDAATNS